MGNALRAYARALARCPEVQGIDPQPLLLLARKLVCYGNLQQRSARWTHSAFDTRLVLAGLQVHMLARLTRALEARLNAPGCSRAERERLETPFFKVLMHKERICEMAREHQKILARQRREQEAAAQALAVQIDQETLLANVMAAIRQGHPVDHKTMVEAANILHERERPRA